MAQPLVELKEPLISMETKNNLKDAFLRSYKGIHSQHEQDQDENHGQSEYQASNADQLEPKDAENKRYEHKLQNFAESSNQFLENNDYYQKHIKDFYSKASAAHEFPGLSIQNICYQKSNPNIFAVISRASDLFKEIDVHEFMGFDDYQKLTRIRIRNYVNILRMLTRIDTSEATYQEIKIKLFQVKKLTEYLNITGFEKIYKRLLKNLQIYDLDEELEGDKSEQASVHEDQPEDEEEKKSEHSQHQDEEAEKTSQHEENEDEDAEKSKKDEEEADEEKSQKSGSKAESEEDDSDEYGEEVEEQPEEHNQEDEEYEDFYKLSYLSHGYRGSFTLELEKEELKWIKRAEWLEATIEKLKANDETKGWVPWFQAKLDQLADLDVPIKNVTDNQSNQVFYFYKYIDEMISKFNPEQEYHKDQKVYPEEQNQYPKVKVDINYSLNEASASLKSWTTLREKLCRRVKKRESETDYFLTVFEKKPFGNEKIYEKRINIRGKNMETQSYDQTSETFIMHPNGGYVYFEFTIYSDEKRTFRLVFPLNAQFKDPLFVKKDNNFLFFQDKYLYTTQEVKQKIVKENKKKDDATAGGEPEETAKGDDIQMVVDGEDNEKTKVPDEEKGAEEKDKKDKNDDGENEESEEEEDEYEYFKRVYEYDLVDFNKVRYVDFKKQGDSDTFNADNIEQFFRYRDGFFFLRKKYLDPEEKFFSYEIQYKNDLLKMESAEKFEDATAEAIVKINDKCDRMLVTYWKDGILMFQRYTIDFREKKIKRTDDIKLKQDQVTLDKGKIQIEVEPMYTDFILQFKPAKGKKVFIFQNENFITSIESDIGNLKFYHTQDKGLKKILIVDKNAYVELARCNLVKYQICEQHGEKDKKEWVQSQVNHEIYNRQDEVCFPYAYTIYNHDQVFMKDLTQMDLHGYYYMNSFMGIENGHRPLTIHSVTYNNKLNLSIPVINSNYTANDFLIKVHQIKSCYEQNTMFRFKGLVRFRIYTYNQDILSILSQWSGLSDQKSKLHNDIRISSKYHSMNIEQWYKGKCIQRLVVTHFHLSRDFESRDVTDNEINLAYKPMGCWFILTQRVDNQTQIIEVFTKEMRYSFKFPELLTLKSIWDYNDDDATSNIFGIYVDTLVKDKIDLYILYSNCQMKKFSSPITSQDLVFEEHPHVFNLSSLFKDLGKESGDAASSKKINLYEQYKGDIFVANQVFYSQQGQVDLSALNYLDKFQIGNEIKKSMLKNQNKISKFTYSHNEAKLAAFYRSEDLKKWYDDYPSVTRNGYTLVLTPIWNSRQLPQFQHRAFRHPVVPIVDKEKGCTTVFTLQLGTFYTDAYYTEYHTHDAFRKKMWNKWINVNAGLWIKYFNGVEELVPLHLFGENFSEIIRFQQSKDGRYILIVGTRKGKLEDRFYDQNMLQNMPTQQGMFLYKLSINSIQLIKAFLFAKKNPSTIEQNLLQQMYFPTLKIREEVPQEIPDPQVGEYSMNYLDNDGRQDNVSYEYSLDFKQTDEFYVDELRRLKEAERRKTQEEEEAKNKNRKSGNNRSVSNRKSGLLNSIGADDDNETSNHPFEGEHEAEKPKEEEEFANIARLDDLQILFPGFDIPYLAQKQDWQTTIEQEWRNHLLITEHDAPPVQNKPDHISQYTYENEKQDAVLFSEEQVQKIKMIHGNMHLETNEQGHIFLINRLCNKLYFFYECHGEYKVASLKFENDFVIETADSSTKYLVVTAIERKEGQNDHHRYRILDIEKMINCEEHDRRFTLNELDVIYDSRRMENLGIIKVIVGNDEYSYNIKDCKIMDDFLILKVTDNQNIHYLKVFDMKKKILIHYIEGKRFLISGDKRYIWIMETNEVYDIVNGLSTFFMWPGDQINTHAYDHMDIFNISEDRTIMITQGYLQLAFNYFSYIIDEEIQGANFKVNDAFFTKANNLNYLCYKISDYKSILEKIFVEDYDKLSYNKFEVNQDDSERVEQDNLSPEEIENKRVTKEASQNKQISNLLAYFTSFYDPETSNPAVISLFFLSFYSRNKNPQQDGGKQNLKYMNIFQKLFSLTDKRGDLIEDILNYVVHCSTVPITQQVINSCFTKFLVNANSSQSFQYYLNNITSQTSTMKEVEKFQIASTEIGFIVESHNSPIMDDRFYTKFRDITQNKQDVEIFYINLGTLLIDHGSEIMEMLSDKKYLSIMDVPFIRYLVMYQWINIKHTIHQRLLVPFMILLFLFTLYTTTIDFHSYEEGQEPEAPYQIFILNWINSILLIGVLSYFLKVEAKQFVLDPSDYFTDFWNISDLFSYCMCVIVIIFDRTPVPQTINRPIASLCLIILWIKMFYFLRVFESTSKLIRMIIEIVNDMKNFLIVLFIGIIGFSGGFFILQQAVAVDPEKGPPIGNYILSVIYTYRLASGDFQLDFFDDLGGADYVLAWFLFIFGSLFLVIVLLNLLIAIMGDTFSRVLESITNLTVREKVMLISENEALFNRDQRFQSAQFLIVITEKNLDTVQGENWDGQINMLKRQVLDKVSSLEVNLDTKITENQKDLKKKIMEQEERSKKLSTMQEQRIQSTVKLEFIEAFLKINEQFGLQQNAIKTQSQTLAQEQMRTMKMLQEQIEQVRSDQSRLSQAVQKAVGGNANADNESEEE